MAGMNEDEMRNLERRSRAAFDASVEATDAATRSRLAQARRAALAGRDRGRFGRAAAWVPMGAAAAAVVAALLWQREDAPGPSPRQPAVAFEDIDIVTGGEDFDLLGEDADFVAWAAEEIPDDVG
jgi:hypothetical protein